MPVGRDAGIGGVALAAGLAAGLALGGGEGADPAAKARRPAAVEAAIRTGTLVRDVSQARVEETDVGMVVRIDRMAPKAGVAGEDVLVEVNEYTPQYVANALESCRKYQEERGEEAPRLAYWQAFKDKFEAAGVVLPLPEELE